MIDFHNRYKVNLYHGGESPDEVKWTDSLEEARIVGSYAEHSVIEYRGKFVEQIRQRVQKDTLVCPTIMSYNQNN